MREERTRKTRACLAEQQKTKMNGYKLIELGPPWYRIELQVNLYRNATLNLGDNP
jgi:hypothetical protein